MREIIKKIINKMPLKNTIIFESNPDMADNTYPVYKWLVDHGVNNKYKLVWLVNDKSQFDDYKESNVKFESLYPENLIGRMKYYYLVRTAKGLVFCNRMIPKLNSKQFSIFLSHGSPLKSLNDYKIHNQCDFFLSQSKFWEDINAREFDVDKNKLICLGYPRNDYLFSNKNVLGNIIGDSKFDKVIIWLPTFKQHKGGATDAPKTDIGIAAINSIHDFQLLNDKLIQSKTLLLFKPHPAQDLSAIKQEKLSNFMFIDDKILAKDNIQLYELLAQTDALITDYSSVYYDYLLLNKPIGLTVDDYEQYKEHRGFAFDDIYEVVKGEYIVNTSDLMNFIGNVANGIDESYEERIATKELTNQFQDADSSKRVGEFILSQLDNIN